MRRTLCSSLICSADNIVPSPLTKYFLDEADFLEALIIAVEQITKGTAGKKSIGQKEVLIFSDGGMTFAEGGQLAKIYGASLIFFF